MTDWFQTLAAGNHLPTQAADELQERGFVVLPDALPAGGFPDVCTAYDEAVASATGPDLRVGSTSTRVNDFVNRGSAFDSVYLSPALLQVCCLVIGVPFKLSSFHARTLRAGAPDQGLHVDVDRRSADWPLVGFILMIDEFRPDNGATRFVPGTHLRTDVPAGEIPEALMAGTNQVAACGPAGSFIVFNGSTWHGHRTNMSGGPRRSLQGAFIPGAGRSGTDFAARMAPATRQRLGPLAHYLLGL